MSTGCIGYVSETSIEHLLDTTADNGPWMTQSVLRMFSFVPSDELPGERRHVTDRMDGTLLQRRFVDEEEQAHVIENLQAMGIDPAGKEQQGWYHANVYLWRPVEDAEAPVTLTA
jgi:carnitine O-acetyltransferase